MELDSGAGVSVMSSQLFYKLFPQLSVSPSTTTVYAVSGPVKVEGETLVTVEVDGKCFDLCLFVCSEITLAYPLLGRAWLDIITPQWRSIFSSNSLNQISIYLMLLRLRNSS